jgi:hypothetical protein
MGFDPGFDRSPCLIGNRELNCELFSPNAGPATEAGNGRNFAAKGGMDVILSPLLAVIRKGNPAGGKPKWLRIKSSVNSLLYSPQTLPVIAG